MSPIGRRERDSPERAVLWAYWPASVTFEEMEAALRARLEALPPAGRAELVHVLRLADFDRVDRIGSFYGNPKTRSFAELLIDCEEDRTLRAVSVGMLREAERSNPSRGVPRPRAGDTVV